MQHALGYRRHHVRCQLDGHPLAPGSDVDEWVRGTLLTAYQERMPADMYERFVERYRDRLGVCVDPAAPFFFSFKRILMWAAR